MWINTVYRHKLCVCSGWPFWYPVHGQLWVHLGSWRWICSDSASQSHPWLQQVRDVSTSYWQHLCVTLDHKTSHKGSFFQIEIDTSSGRGINNISIDVWFVMKLQYLKIWNLMLQKNLNIEKIAFKVVQMKSLAMHILLIKNKFLNKIRIYLVKNTIKTLIFKNIITNQINCFLFLYILNCSLFLWSAYSFSSEIILICRFAFYCFWFLTFDRYECLKQLCCFILLWKQGCIFIFRILWWIESSKEQHLSEREIFSNFIHVFLINVLHLWFLNVLSILHDLFFSLSEQSCWSCYWHVSLKKCTSLHLRHTHSTPGSRSFALEKTGNLVCTHLFSLVVMQQLKFALSVCQTRPAALHLSP